MSHSYSKVWIHAVWATKYRKQILDPQIEKTVFVFLANQLKELGCQVGIINGMPDHIHCLYLQNPDKTIADIIKQIKGSSTYFINQQHLIGGKFAWQTGYGAFSVSELGVDKVFKYIANQKKHHRKRTFQLEYEEFIKIHNLD